MFGDWYSKWVGVFGGPEAVGMHSTLQGASTWNSTTWDSHSTPEGHVVSPCLKCERFTGLPGASLRHSEVLV